LENNRLRRDCGVVEISRTIEGFYQRASALTAAEDSPTVWGRWQHRRQRGTGVVTQPCYKLRKGNFAQSRRCLLMGGYAGGTVCRY